MPTPILPAPAPSRPPPSPRRRLALGLLFAAGGLSLAGVALAQAVDTFGPPPAGDPSANLTLCAFLNIFEHVQFDDSL